MASGRGSAASIVAGVVTLAILRAEAAQSPALKIVVIEGEHAVNVVQQKAATAPVVEIRDRNGQPIAGAVVRFTIRAGRASFGGSRTVTVTASSLGRAAGAGLAPTGTGPISIGVTATANGQAAAAVIAQTNVMTAAEAAAAASAGGASGGAGGAAGAGAAGGSGGLSATTIGLVAGAAAGGTLLAKEVVGGSTSYAGTYAGNVPHSFGPSCTATEAHTGTVTIELTLRDDGSVSGEGDVEGTGTAVSASAGCPANMVGRVDAHGCCDTAPAVVGTTSGMTFHGAHPGLAGTTWNYDFAGVLNGSDVTGTFTLTVNSPGAPDFVASFPVVLKAG